MSENMIFYVFKILGMLLLAYILFYALFSTNGQDMLWNASKEAVEKQWNESTMNNGADRTLIYEGLFDSVYNDTNNKYKVN